MEETLFDAAPIAPLVKMASHKNCKARSAARFLQKNIRQAVQETAPAELL